MVKFQWIINGVSGCQSFHLIVIGYFMLKSRTVWKLKFDNIMDKWSENYRDLLISDIMFNESFANGTKFNP